MRDARGDRSRTGRGSKRQRASLTVAILAHSLLLWIARDAPPRRMVGEAAHLAPLDADFRGVDLELPEDAEKQVIETARHEARRAPPRALRSRPSAGAAGDTVERSAPVDCTGADCAKQEGAPGEGPPGDGYDAPDPGDQPLLPGLTLTARVAMGPPASPAPTTTPRPKQVTGEDVERGLGAEIRADDALVGLGNREESAAAVAVRLAAIKAPVPDKTRVQFAVDVDAAGNVTAVSVVSASAGDTTVWNDVLAEVRSALAAHPLDVGPEARRAGVRVIVDAKIVHVFSDGTDGTPVVGECPKMPRIGGEAPEPFGAMGGAMWGEDPNGTCVLGGGIGDYAHKHIEVRTTTKAIIPGAPPPSMAHFPVPKKKRINLLKLIFDLESIESK